MKPCSFCDRDAEKTRIIVESESAYVMPTLGQISDGGHVLLVSKEHLPCFGALGRKRLEELEVFKAKVEGAVRRIYGPTICFEHGIIGQTVPHAHFQILPSATDLFQTLSRRYPFYRGLGSLAELEDVFNDRRVYLYYENQQGKKVAFIMDAIPQYMRFVAAEAIGKVPRGDWKAWRADIDCARTDDWLIFDTVRELKRELGVSNQDLD